MVVPSEIRPPLIGRDTPYLLTGTVVMCWLLRWHTKRFPLLSEPAGRVFPSQISQAGVDMHASFVIDECFNNHFEKEQIRLHLLSLALPLSYRLGVPYHLLCMLAIGRSVICEPLCRHLYKATPGPNFKNRVDLPQCWQRGAGANTRQPNALAEVVGRTCYTTWRQPYRFYCRSRHRICGGESMV